MQRNGACCGCHRAGPAAGGSPPHRPLPPAPLEGEVAQRLGAGGAGPGLLPHQRQVTGKGCLCWEAAQRVTEGQGQNLYTGRVQGCRCPFKGCSGANAPAGAVQQRAGQQATQQQHQRALGAGRASAAPGVPTAAPLEASSGRNCLKSTAAAHTLCARLVPLHTHPHTQPSPPPTPHPIPTPHTPSPPAPPTQLAGHGNRLPMPPAPRLGLPSGAQQHRHLGQPAAAAAGRGAHPQVVAGAGVAADRRHV